MTVVVVCVQSGLVSPTVISVVLYFMSGLQVTPEAYVDVHVSITNAPQPVLPL